jgi:hypothetical protein
LKYAEIFENISFVVFGAVYFFVYGRLREESLREFDSFVNVSHHRPYNTERRSFVWEIKFLNFIVCLCVCVCVCVCVCL